jgi:hypothetical protein
MNKELIFHLYIGNDIDTNLSYKIHKECLKFYKDIFDKVKIILVLDDLKDQTLKMKGFSFINDINFNCETNIVIRENTFFYEVDTLTKELLDVNNSNDNICFFAHNKGTTNFRNIKKHGYNENSLIYWILVMYFYNLNYIKEVENVLTGKMGLPEVMYGTLLLENNTVNNILGYSKYHFSGAFYWFNNQFYKNLVHSNRLSSFVPATRMDGEMMPGYLFDRSVYGGGLRTHNDAAFNFEDYCGRFYYQTEKEWDYIINILGDKLEFYNFKEKIEDKLK